MLKESGVFDLKEVSMNRKLFIFGAGRISRNTFKRFAGARLEKCISAIIDNNADLWNTYIDINGTSMIIKSLDQVVQDIGDKPVAIAVFVKESSDIEEQLRQSFIGRDAVLYSYPKCLSLNEQKWIEQYTNYPLEDRLLMQGEGDNCENASAIYDYIKDNNLLGRFKVVWLCDHPQNFADTENVTYLDRNIYNNASTDEELRHYLELVYTSKYVFYENYNLFKFRKDQVSVYLKHGTFPLKNVKGVLWIPDDVDKIICTSENYADHAAYMESCDREKLLICGSPRLDYLYKDKHVLEKLKKYEEGINYYLWLPTMRQTAHGRSDVTRQSPYGIPLINSEEEFEQIDFCLEQEKSKLIIKPHPHQDLSLYKIGKYKNIMLITNAELEEHDFTIHSLMREAVALISDYSSIAFDYMLLDRPIAYTVDDIDEYKIGFSVDDPFHYMPGRKLANVKDMLDFIMATNEGIDDHLEQRHEIRDYIHHYQDGRNAERFMKMMGMI